MFRYNFKTKVYFGLLQEDIEVSFSMSLLLRLHCCIARQCFLIWSVKQCMIFSTWGIRTNHLNFQWQTYHVEFKSHFMEAHTSSVLQLRNGCHPANGLKIFLFWLFNLRVEWLEIAWLLSQCQKQRSRKSYASTNNCFYISVFLSSLIHTLKHAIIWKNLYW